MLATKTDWMQYLPLLVWLKLLSKNVKNYWFRLWALLWAMATAIIHCCSLFMRTSWRCAIFVFVIVTDQTPHFCPPYTQFSQFSWKFCELMSALRFGWILHLTNREVFCPLSHKHALSLSLTLSLPSHKYRKHPCTSYTMYVIHILCQACVVISCNRMSKCGVCRLFCRWKHTLIHTYTHMNPLFIEKFVTFRNKYKCFFDVTKWKIRAKVRERENGVKCKALVCINMAGAYLKKHWDKTLLLQVKKNWEENRKPEIKFPWNKLLTAFCFDSCKKR